MDLELDLELDKTPLVPVKDKSLVIKVIRKKKKVIVKGKIEANMNVYRIVLLQLKEQVSLHGKLHKGKTNWNRIRG
ncbi:hypothetical protein [Peribacillus sp. Hz7]|uniref:hypothetical protein n=1 Tax=Peribacillus sp. Hz7 TaxID=3344873 RepID=UPI0035CC8AB0